MGALVRSLPGSVGSPWFRCRGVFAGAERDPSPRRLSERRAWRAPPPPAAPDGACPLLALSGPGRSGGRAGETPPGAPLAGRAAGGGAWAHLLGGGVSSSERRWRPGGAIGRRRCVAASRREAFPGEEGAFAGPSPSARGSAMAASLEPQSYVEGLSHSTVKPESSAGPNPALLRTDPSCRQPFAAVCSVPCHRPAQQGDSPTEQVWQQKSSQSSSTSQFSGINDSRFIGNYLSSPEFSVPVQDCSHLSHFQIKRLQTRSFNSQENWSLGQQQEAGANANAQTFLTYGGISANSCQPLAEIQPSFASNGSPQTPKSSGDSDILPHSFLATTFGHNSQSGANQQNHGINMHPQPPLPEKKSTSEGERSFSSISPSSSGFSSPHSGSTISIPFPNVLPDFSKVLNASPLPENTADKQVTVKFVQDTSKFWYKPEISREQAIAVLKDKEPGSFIVRDSHSFRGAYGLAMKVATPPPSVLQLNKKVGDLSNELVRHFLIECTHKGVRLKGCLNEPYFGSLTALVYQHSITPLALPCKLLIPDQDPLEETPESSPQTAANSAAELLKQGAACNVWYLNSVEMESLTGYQAVQKALSLTLAEEPPPVSTVVHFKVSAQGITLTDNQRKLFFRRHYPVNTVIFCALDPQDRKWMKESLSAKVFGFVARKQGDTADNVCHLFAENDPEQPASAIVNFVSKVMIGSQKKN